MSQIALPVFLVLVEIPALTVLIAYRDDEGEQGEEQGQSSESQRALPYQVLPPPPPQDVWDPETIGLGYRLTLHVKCRAMSWSVPRWMSLIDMNLWLL